MRLIRPVISSLILSTTVACGASDDEPATPGDSDKSGFPEGSLPEELVADLPLVAPTSDLDIPVFSGVVDVEPGADVTYCTYTDIILDEATIFGESFGAQSPQGHHAILQYAPTAVEPGTRSCEQEDMGATILLGGTGGKAVKDTPDLPTNYGVEVPAGAQLVLNHHWINTSLETVHGQAMMLARRLEAGGDTVLAGNMIMIGLGWEIPAKSEATYSTECTFEEDVGYVTALGHMHEYGSHVSISVTRGSGAAESIIDTPWSEDMATGASGQLLYSLDEPLMIHAGDTVKLTCNWDNESDETIGFPREMCIFFGNTVGQNFFCANGMWLDEEAAQAAGSQEIIDNL